MKGMQIIIEYYIYAGFPTTPINKFRINKCGVGTVPTKDPPYGDKPESTSV